MSAGLSGFRAWILQRITAVLIAVGFLVAMVVLWMHDWTYAEWRAFVRTPLVTVSVLILYGAVLLHAWIGVRDIVIDYVHPLMARLVVLAVVGTVLVGLAIWAGTILLPGSSA